MPDDAAPSAPLPDGYPYEVGCCDPPCDDCTCPHHEAAPSAPPSALGGPHSSRAGHPCECPICGYGRAMEAADLAYNILLDQMTEMEMQFHHTLDVLGELIDALSDDLQEEVSHSEGTKRAIRAGCRVLGGSFTPYLESWWLADV